MDAVIVQIADAVETTLNAASKDGGLSQPFEAERLYDPVQELEDLDTLKVSVVSAADDSELMTRSSVVMTDYQIFVGVQIRVDSIRRAIIDPYVLLCEQIKILFLGQFLTLANASEVLCVKAVIRPIFDNVHLDEKRVFTSVLTLTFRQGK